MVSGIVEKVVSKTFNGKLFHSIKLVNDDYYGFGMYAPKVDAGDKVSFEAEKNQRGYWQADRNTLKVTKAEPENRSNGVQAAQVYTRKGPEEKGYWDRRESREVENDRLRSLGAARNTAIEWVRFLVDKEVIPVPKKVAEREDSLNAILDDYTLKFMSGVAPEERPDPLALKDHDVAKAALAPPSEKAQAQAAVDEVWE